MSPCLTLSIIRYGSRVKWSNPGKGVAPFPTPWCCSYRKGSLGLPSTMVANFTYLLTMIKITKPIELMRSGKVAGVDRIPSELWKDVGPALHSKLHELLVCCWEQDKLPSDLRHAVIVTKYKNKGEKSDCSKYQWITLLSITVKKNPCSCAPKHIVTHLR